MSLENVSVAMVVITLEVAKDTHMGFNIFLMTIHQILTLAKCFSNGG